MGREISVACVLVVEDEEQVRVLAEAIIQDLGHQTLTAGDLAEAVALLDEAGNVDLLFTDLGLVEERHGGISVAEYARTKRPEIAVVYTTGAGVNDGTRALVVDRHWFLAKPYRPSDLEIILGNALADRQAPTTN